MDDTADGRIKCSITGRSGVIFKVEDMEFDSPSGAAEFVLGMSAGGPREWKTKDGVPLKNFLQ